MQVKEERPWGNYQVLYDGEDCKVKRITVNPAARLSLQWHQHRSETWKIISGEGTVTKGGTEHPASAGDTFHIQAGIPHRIASAEKVPLVFVEIQTGSYFGEDDIVRIQDDYERK